MNKKEELTRERVLEILRDDCSEIAREIFYLQADMHKELYFQDGKLLFSKPKIGKMQGDRHDKIGVIKSLGAETTLFWCPYCKKLHTRPKEETDIRRLLDEADHGEDAAQDAIDEISIQIDRNPTLYVEEICGAKRKVMP